MGRTMGFFVVLAAVLACCALPALAAEARYGDSAVAAEGFSSPGNLTDGDRTAVRFVTSFATPQESVDGLLAALRRLK